MGRIMSMRDAVSTAAIVHAAQRGATVARLIDDHIFEGVARSIGDEHGYFAGNDRDVRDCLLRVTLTSGTDVFWNVGNLIDAMDDGEFVIR